MIYLVNIVVRHNRESLVPPAGCLYVGDALKKSGYEVMILQLYDDEIEGTVSRIVASHPLFVGFSVVTGAPVALSARMSQLIKKEAHEISIVWGGIHPTILPELCLKEDFVDYKCEFPATCDVNTSLDENRDIEDLLNCIHEFSNDGFRDEACRRLGL